MNHAYLLTGGNMGDRLLYLRQARHAIGKEGRIVQASSVYETEAWGLQDQPLFCNQAIALQTDHSAEALLERLLSIEKTMGRTRQERYGPRLIDIDILFYNDAVIDQEGLHIPHPEVHNRRFALACLNEIAPDLVHPVTGKTVAQMLAACGDPLRVYKIS
ncbi:MAG TPA: 2-amino-4-hydroxy-6-hydroxymethyldihydropteridine diphosphokinase [Flavisolibacter sp.]